MNHSWNVTPQQAMRIQKDLQDQVSIEPLAKEPRYIAGVDVSMNLHSTIGYAGFIVLSFPDLRMVEQSVVKNEITFPYIPGLLSFREIPSLLKAWQKLQIKPDLIFVDGIGLAHPRRFGIACHLGVVLNTPTVGCAKKILTGVCVEPVKTRGGYSYLYDRKHKQEVIGAMVRTKDHVKPMNISVGHKITLEQSIKYVLQTTVKHRLPEATRHAHNIMNQFRLADQSSQPQLLITPSAKLVMERH